MPVERTAAFVAAGAGMSPVHHGYSLDGSIQLTPFYDAVGDLRMRLVPEGVRVLPGGLAAGPTHVVTQDGEPDPTAPRHVLAEMVDRLAAAGLTARVGHELEFVLVAPDGSALPHAAWTPYGLTALVDRSALIGETVDVATAAGLGIEQVHAEYGPHQLEVSLSPEAPVAAADSVILLKTVIGIVTRAHGLAASFSPVPFASTVGNGAHQHLSLAAEGVDLFDDPAVTTPHRISTRGGHAIAGLLDGLIGAQAVLTGSIVSGRRLRPGLVGSDDLLGRREPRGRSAIPRRRTLEPARREHRGEARRPVGKPLPRLGGAARPAHDGIERRLPLPPETVRDTGQLDDADRARAGPRSS